MSEYGNSVLRKKRELERWRLGLSSGIARQKRMLSMFGVVMKIASSNRSSVSILPVGISI